MPYDYDRTSGKTATKSLNLQHMTVWQIKVQWAHDVITAVSELANHLPGAGAMHHNMGVFPTLTIDGIDKSDFAWNATIELAWRKDTLRAEITLAHPMRGTKRIEKTFDEDSAAMEIGQACLKSLQSLLG